jgi:hypothetical protein
MSVEFKPDETLAASAVAAAALASIEATAAQSVADEALLFTRAVRIPVTDQTAGGGTVIQWENNTGAPVAISQVVGITGDDEVSLANAAVGSIVGPAMGITLAEIADGATGNILMSGTYRDDTAFAALASGDKLYLDEVAGAIVNEANVPDTIGDVQQRVGQCIHANKGGDGVYVIFFCPSLFEVVKS